MFLRRKIISFLYYKRDVNQNMLITLIRERPVIVDKTVDEYKNKRHKFDARKDIFTRLKINFQDLNSEEKNQFHKLQIFIYLQ